jgi:hypothetical protein
MRYAEKRMASEMFWEKVLNMQVPASNLQIKLLRSKVEGEGAPGVDKGLDRVNSDVMSKKHRRVANLATDCFVVV